jgi:transposase
MNNVTLLAVDLAKNVFQLYGADACGNALFNKSVKRDKLPQVIANLKPCNIYTEGCGSANYWGREFQKYGHQVKILNPKYVKPYVKRNKNDKNDAVAIACAARDPNMIFGDVKTEEQQDIQSTHRIRSEFVYQRTALVNQIRGILAEYGIVIAQGVSNVRKHLPLILGNNEKNLGRLMLMNIHELYQSLVFLDEKIERYNQVIEEIFKQNDVCKRIGEIPGIGVLGATILAAALGNGSRFKNGRHFAAFLGLTPKQHSSGGKEQLLGISKGGDTYIRTLLIHGARAVIKVADKKDDTTSKWLKKLKSSSGFNKAAVALANKNARIAWALVSGECGYVKNHIPEAYRDLH